MTAPNSPPTARPTRTIRRFVGVPFRRQTYRNLTYLALAFPLGLLYFVGVSAGVSLGLGLFVTWLGLPVLVVTVAAATVAAGVEAELARRLLGTDASLPEALRGFDPAGRLALPGDGFLAAVERLLLAPTTWTSVLLVVLRFGFGVVAFAAVVATGTLATSTVGAPLLYDAPHATYRFGTVVVDTLPEALAVAAVGVPLTLSALHLLNALARLGGLLTAAMLAVDGDGTDAGESDA